MLIYAFLLLLSKLQNLWGNSLICALIAFELLFVCVLFVVKENSKLCEVSLRWYEFPLMPYCNLDKVLLLTKNKNKYELSS